MRRALLALPVLLVALFWTSSAKAAIYHLDPLGDCTYADSADACMGLSVTVGTCTDSWGCPQCGMNDKLTNSICYRVFGMWGYCSCQPSGTYVDKWGRTMAHCNTAGSCTSR